MTDQLEQVLVNPGVSSKAPPPHFTEHEQCHVPVAPDNGTPDEGQVERWPPNASEGR